jgi:MFS family permease
MTGPDGSWHESLHHDGPPPGSTDRGFGLLFAALAAVIAIFAAWNGRSSAYGWGAVAVLLAAAAVFAPPLLGPLNRGWRWLALNLSKIMTPLIMGLLFFVVVTPVGLVMRWFGNDPLRLRLEPDNSTYWLARTSSEDRQTSMSRQF